MSMNPYNLPFYNNSGELVPPFAVMQVDDWKDDANDRDYFRVKKPDGDGKQFIINGPYQIPVAGDGMGSREPGVHASYGSGTPAVDQVWGPLSGDWTLSSSGSGYFIVGDLETIGSITVVRVSEAGGGGGTQIYAQVDEAGGVGPGDPTFSFKNAISLGGNAPAGGTGTAQNQYAQTYAFEDWVILAQRKDNSQWLTERGGTAGSQVVHFELTQDMAYADLAKLAKPVNDDGSLNTGADAFYVVDMRAVDTSGTYGEYYGKATYTDADTGAVVWSGYQGYAARFTDDYAGGIPGYKIVSMDGPVDFFIGECAESITSGAAKVTYDDTINPAGSPFSGRRPPLLADTRVTVYDDFDLEPETGDKWVCKWDRAAGHYVYWRPVESSGGVVQLATVNESGHVQSDDATFAFDGGASAGIGSHDSTGTINNIFGDFYDNDEVILVQKRDDGNFQPVQRKTGAVFVTTGTISAASWNSGASELTDGSGNAKRLMRKSGSSTVRGLFATAVTIYNQVEDSIASGTRVQCKWIDGKWYADVETC